MLLSLKGRKVTVTQHFLRVAYNNYKKSSLKVQRETILNVLGISFLPTEISLRILVTKMLGKNGSECEFRLASLFYFLEPAASSGTIL